MYYKTFVYFLFVFRRLWMLRYVMSSPVYSDRHHQFRRLTKHFLCLCQHIDAVISLLVDDKKKKTLAASKLSVKKFRMKKPVEKFPWILCRISLAPNWQYTSYWNKWQLKLIQSNKFKQLIEFLSLRIFLLWRFYIASTRMDVALSRARFPLNNAKRLRDS